MQAEHYGRLALYETEDVPYRMDAEQFVKEYAKELKKRHDQLELRRTTWLEVDQQFKASALV